jgi:hypothetical protein
MVAFNDEPSIACDSAIARVRVHERIIMWKTIMTLARSNGGTPSVEEKDDVYELLRCLVM